MSRFSVLLLVPSYHRLVPEMQASIAHADPEDTVKQHLYCMNHANDVYREASKHVKLHAQQPKPKAKSKADAAAKGAAKAKGKK